jgi:hypothetical protein
MGLLTGQGFYKVRDSSPNRELDFMVADMASR